MNPEPIAKTVEALIGKLAKENEQGAGSKIIKLIEANFDKDAKKHLMPGNLKNGILRLIIDSPSYKYVLNLKKRQLLENFQKELGEDFIKDIRFVIGKVK